MAADTSSAAAGSSWVVCAAAAALASPIIEPIPVKSPAADVISSGVAIISDIWHLSNQAPSCHRSSANDRLLQTVQRFPTKHPKILTKPSYFEWSRRQRPRGPQLIRL